MRPLLFLCLAVVTVQASACALSWRPSVQWLDVATLTERPTQADYPGADAVYLNLETQFHQAVNLTQEKPSSSKAVHAALVVLNESGQRYSNVRIRLGKKTEVRQMRARSIAPDGTITPLNPDRIYDDESKEEGDTILRVFAMPKVQVGSVIEYQYVTLKPGLWLSFGFDLWRRAPIQRRVVRFVVDTKRTRWRAKAYHTDVPFQVDKGSPYTTITWEGRDLPADDGEPYDPPHREVVPRLQFVFTQLVVYSGRGVWSYYRTWDDAVESRFEDMVVEREFAKGYKLSPTMKKLRSAPISERIKAAYDLGRLIPYAGPEGYDPRPFGRILRERIADDYEKALLTHHVLSELGVEAWLALTRQQSMGPIDRTFPSDGQLNTLVVRVPIQSGLATPMWLQPWCTHCAAGEVTHRLDGASSYVLKGTPSAVGEQKPEGAWETIDAPLAPTETYRRSTTMKLSANGSVSAETRWDYGGAWGARRREWKTLKTDKEIRKKVGKWIRQDYPNATVDNVDFGLVEKPGAPVIITCTWTDQDVAKRVDGKLLIQLDKGGLGWKGDPFERGEVRARDIVFWRPKLSAITHTITPPTGFAFGALPENEERSEPFASYRSTWRLDGANLVHELTEERKPGRWGSSEIDTFRDFFDAYRMTMDPVITLAPAAK